MGGEEDVGGSEEEEQRGERKCVFEIRISVFFPFLLFFYQIWRDKQNFLLI